MKRREVSSGDNELKLELGMIDDRAQDRSLQEILGANRSDAEDASFRSYAFERLPTARGRDQFCCSFWFVEQEIEGR